MNLKKSIAVLGIATLALTMSATAFAKDKGDQKDNGLHLGQLKNLDKRLDKFEDRHLSDSQFVLTGSVASASANTVVVNVKHTLHVANLVNSQATVQVGPSTKITGEKNQVLTFADIKDGQQVVIVGTVSGSTLTATTIHIMTVVGKAYGEVTAKTDTSITVKNNVTGLTQTFTTDTSTKVKVNGETKTTADVHVGDKGFVRFKTTVSGMFAKLVNLFR